MTYLYEDDLTENCKWVGNNKAKHSGLEMGLNFLKSNARNLLGAWK